MKAITRICVTLGLSAAVLVGMVVVTVHSVDDSHAAEAHEFAPIEAEHEATAERFQELAKRIEQERKNDEARREAEYSNTANGLKLRALQGQNEAAVLKVQLR